MGHHHVAHAVVAVDQRGGGAALDHLDRRLRIDGAALELAHIGREPEDAVGVRADEVGFQHRAGGGRGIGFGEPAGSQGVGEEGTQGGGEDASGMSDSVLVSTGGLSRGGSVLGAAVRGRAQ